jgi:hypothetical protein
MVISGVKEAITPRMVEEPPSDFANRMMGAPIITWKDNALKNWNKWELKAPGG